MTLESEGAEKPLDEAETSDRASDTPLPMLPAAKRTRIFAVLSFAYNADSDPVEGLDLLLKACQRKHQEDKQLGTAVELILENIRKDGNLGDALGKVLGRMLAVDEAAILQVLAKDFVAGAPKSTTQACRAMDMLLRLREIDLLEGPRQQ